MFVVWLLLLGAAPSRTTADTTLAVAVAESQLAALWKQARAHEDARRPLGPLNASASPTPATDFTGTFRAMLGFTPSEALRTSKFIQDRSLSAR